MKILVSGASGLIGSALKQRLQERGDEVIPLARRSSDAGVVLEPVVLEPVVACDAVVHLAGENIASGRWTRARKEAFHRSRVDLTETLVDALGRLERPPATLVCASAIGYYGDRGDETLDEHSPAGRGFLADLCRDWEAAAAAATTLGTRVVSLRTGLVLSRDGGGLSRMLRAFRLGLGGVLGDGTARVSWIHIDDLVRLVEFVLCRPELAGAVNATSPGVVTNREFTTSLGRVLRRPTLLPVPAFALRALFGEMADEVLLASAAVAPRVALHAGFEFRFADLESALRDLC